MKFVFILFAGYFAQEENLLSQNYQQKGGKIDVQKSPDINSSIHMNVKEIPKQFLNRVN